MRVEAVLRQSWLSYVALSVLSADFEIVLSICGIPSGPPEREAELVRRVCIVILEIVDLVYAGEVDKVHALAIFDLEEGIVDLVVDPGEAIVGCRVLRVEDQPDIASLI